MGMTADVTGLGGRPIDSDGSPDGRSLVVLGDSITYGWGVAQGSSYPALLESLLNRSRRARPTWQVVNAGIPGHTVIHGCLRYEHDVQVHAPRLVLIAFGLNDGSLRRTAVDLWREQTWLAQRVHLARTYAVWSRWRKRLPSVAQPLAEEHLCAPRIRRWFFERGLADLIRRARRDGARVCLVSLSPVVRSLIGERQWHSYVRYNESVRKVAARCKTPLVDLWENHASHFRAEEMSSDGVHLTAAGQRWMAARVFESLESEGLV